MLYIYTFKKNVYIIFIYIYMFLYCYLSIYIYRYIYLLRRCIYINIYIVYIYLSTRTNARLAPYWAFAAQETRLCSPKPPWTPLMRLGSRRLQLHPSGWICLVLKKINVEQDPLNSSSSIPKKKHQNVSFTSMKLSQIWII